MGLTDPVCASESSTGSTTMISFNVKTGTEPRMAKPIAQRGTEVVQDALHILHKYNRFWLYLPLHCTKNIQRDARDCFLKICEIRGVYVLPRNRKGSG